jgi:hypothetical protein
VPAPHDKNNKYVCGGQIKQYLPLSLNTHLGLLKITFLDGILFLIVKFFQMNKLSQDLMSMGIA